MRLENEEVTGTVSILEKMLIKGRDDMAKAKRVVSDDAEMPASGKEFLGGLASAYDNLADAMEVLIKLVVSQSKQKNGGNAKAGPPGGTFAAAAAAAPRSAPKPQPNPAEVKKKKFAQNVREAEKSLLIFDLDLGKVQIMNTNTIAKNVTQDVVRKAAKAEGKADGRPCEETVTILDDTLSMVTGMDFYGKVTRPYYNKRNVNDTANGTFCTMPVKLNFKTKEAKVHAETVLKKNCGIRGSTPLPQKVRKLIGSTIADHKAKFPGCFIQVRIDTEILALKVSRRNDKKEWTNNYETIMLGMDVMDLDTVRNTDNAMEVVVSQPSL
jgi:hypothetical protein